MFAVFCALALHCANVSKVECAVLLINRHQTLPRAHTLLPPRLSLSLPLSPPLSLSLPAAALYVSQR